jgi:hypothetical protein
MEATIMTPYYSVVSEFSPDGPAYSQFHYYHVRRDRSRRTMPGTEDVSLALKMAAYEVVEACALVARVYSSCHPFEHHLVAEYKSGQFKSREDFMACVFNTRR